MSRQEGLQRIREALDDAARVLSDFTPGAVEHRVKEGDDLLMIEADRPDVAPLLVPLPIDVVYALSLGQAVHLAASGIEMTDDEVAVVIDACWRAITKSS